MILGQTDIRVNIINILAHIQKNFALVSERIPTIYIRGQSEAFYPRPVQKGNKLSQFSENTPYVLTIFENQLINTMPASIQCLCYLHDFLVAFFLCLLTEAWRQRTLLTGPWLNGREIPGYTCIQEYVERAKEEHRPLTKAISTLRHRYDLLALRDTRDVHEEAAELLTAYVLGFAYQGPFFPPNPRAFNENGEKNQNRLFANHPLLEEWCEHFLKLVPTVTF